MKKLQGITKEKQIKEQEGGFYVLLLPVNDSLEIELYKYIIYFIVLCLTCNTCK